MRAVLFLIVVLLLLAPMVAAHEGVWQAERVAPSTAPRLGAFINIWLETNVDNLEPAVAYNSSHCEFLVVWSNTRSGGATKDIYARRVRADGTLLSDFAIAHNANFRNYQPAVAYSPAQDEYLVVYTYDSVITDSDIWARRVRWDGSWMSSEFAVGRKTDKQHYPAVAYNSHVDEYLVVYQNTWAGGGQDIDAERVRASDGTPLGWVNIAAGTGLRSFPDVAHNAISNHYLIAYTFRPSSVLDPGDIYGKTASWNFDDIGPEHHICDDVNDQRTVSVAAAGEEFLAVWEDSPSATTTELYARRLDPFGTPLGPAGGYWITGNPGRHDTAPSVAASAGHRYLIVWQRFMGGLDYNVYGRYAVPGRDYGAGSEFAFDNDVRAQMAPAVACANHVGCLMAEEDSNSTGGDFEIRGRLAWLYDVYLPLSPRGLQ
jgi:hypothetical protein